MSEMLLCRWLNQELQLSKVVGMDTLATDFSNGYLIGEILHKYKLQDNFNKFLEKNTSISKVNNFMRLEPTLKLLGISFNMNTAQDLMQEKQGVAAHLLFQLYDALKKRKSPEMKRSLMEVEQPRAEANLYRRERKIYRLPQVMKRDTDQKLQLYSDKHHRFKERTVGRQRLQLQRLLNAQDEKIMKNTDKATDIHVPKPPYRVSPLIIKRRQQKIQEEAKRVQTEIAQFEKNMRKSVTYGFSSSSSSQPLPAEASLSGTKQGNKLSESGAGLSLQSNTKYMQEIRQRLKEKALADERRQKRQDRFLVEQFKAHAAQQELQRDEQLVKRLTRQTKQEQRLVAQLLQMRMQKEVIRENRLFVEQQYQERREKDFREALYREAVLAQQEKVAREEEIRKDVELCTRISAEQSQNKRKKYFNHCKELLNQIVDLATKVGDYRQLTENTIPEQTMRDWKELFLKGLPLYEPSHEQSLELSALKDSIDLTKLPQEALNNLDYHEYAKMIGDWAWPEEAGEIKPPSAKSILENVVRRLKNIVCSSTAKPPNSEYSHFIIKACVLGNICSGKTTCLDRIAEALGIYVLSSDTLVEESLKAYHDGEEVMEKREDKDKRRKASARLSKHDITIQESRSCITKPSPRALLGAAVDKELKKGNAIPNELLVEIMTQAIRQVPAHSGWILDGFPPDISLAHLLEKALGGCEEETKEAAIDQTDIIADCSPPTPPPPPAPVLDVVLMLNIPDECAVRRAYRQADTCVAASQPAEKMLYLAEVTHRIAAFKGAWPALEKWYSGKQNILVTVDADVDEDEVYNRVKLILQKILEKKPRGGASPYMCSMDARRLSRAEVEKPQSPKAGQSRSGTPTSLSQRNSPVQKLLRSASSCSLDYEDEPLSPEIPPLLWSLWDSVCNSYVNNIKKVMQQLRLQRTVVLHELSSIRDGYRHCLGRPNLKQEFVCRWQKDFNSIPDYLREDEEIKAELHQRLDELCESLWDTTDKCKEQDEQKKAALLSDEWLEEHTAALINSHSILMQVELNRFHQTMCILRIYFLNLQKKQVTFESLCENTYIPLLEIPEAKAEDESEIPMDTNEMHKREEKSTKVTLPQTHPVSPKEVSMTTSTDKAQPEKHLHDKLICNYEDALKVIETFPISLDICELKETDQKEAKEPERPQVEEASSKAKKTPKGKRSFGKLKGEEPEKTEPQIPSEKTETKEMTGKFHQEYAAALDHEGNRAKMRLELVKNHGLVMLHSLQSRTQRTLSQMETWLQARYRAEMKSIDQLIEMAHHHIMAEAKLQYEVVLEGSDFYLKENPQMVTNLSPPPDPDLSEKPSGFVLSVGALESIHRQLSSVAPSGFLSSSSFHSLLKDMLSINMGKHNLPKLWVDNQTLLGEIVSVLTDSNDRIDWRRFLLCASLPWPVPSLAQLLYALQSFKLADVYETGFINEEQYLQMELWLTYESAQIVSEDLSESLPRSRVANLTKFFFQLFADSSVSPPQLDYVSMLQYFSADPDPRQGFVRALSVVLGQPLRQPSEDHLIMLYQIYPFKFNMWLSSLFQSMPSIEEDTKLTSLEGDGNYNNLSASFGNEKVSISALLKVLFCEDAKMTNNALPHTDLISQEALREVYMELGYEPEECIPFSVLSKHPYIQMLMETSTQYLLVNIHGNLLAHQNKMQTSSSAV
ncbi:sperm flagellar protein 2 isoform X2 [Oryzias melastigma]|uniref:sperm flagellar protein 2 isoform X2 n=1 Tax=Oryzias melastigma TaxID=30732 RepID=UPI00168D56E9|nr:sperm flagellar protein 2 isoform X2 [Oryzias melastigma]